AGGALTLRVLGVTAMQAVLMYTASDDRPCTLRVSESPMLSPLVPDVDPALFPGSNLDSRSGNLSNGRDRVFVVGTRGWAHKAANGRRVSRALQLLTKHYARVDCGADHADSEFSTPNQPLGMTWVEPFPVDPSAPGKDAYPTVDWN